MNTQTGFGVGGAVFAFFAAATLAGATGCASSGGLAGHDALGAAMMQATGARDSGVLVGATHVLDAHVNPLAPLHLSSDGGTIAVRFTRPRDGGAVMHLDGESFAPIGATAHVPAERAPASSNHDPARVVFADGRFIVCWKAGNAEQGYRVMAQAWTGGGSPIGAPVAISPVDSDVLGVPQMVALDGDRAVATFAAFDGDRTELLAVSLEALSL
jgi:hypothetical protein